MGQGIFKPIFGEFVNTFDTHMKIWTLKNILNASISQIYPKFRKIYPFL